MSCIERLSRSFFLLTGNRKILSSPSILFVNLEELGISFFVPWRHGERCGPSAISSLESLDEGETNLIMKKKSFPIPSNGFSSLFLLLLVPYLEADSYSMEFLCRPLYRL